MQKQSLFKNSTYMLFSQAASLICPLLVTIIASQKYDDFVFSANLLAISIAGGLYIFNDLGFYQLIIKRFSDVRSDLKKVSSTLSVIYCQRLLTVSISIMLLFWLPNIGEYQKISNYLFIIMIGVISQAFQPIWIFQAFENVKFYCIFNFISKVLNITLVVLLIYFDTNPYAPVIGFAIGNLFLTLSLNILLYINGYRVYIVKSVRIWSLIKEGKSYSLSRLSTLIYTGLISFLVGINDIKSAGIIALAEQLYKALQLSASPIIQVLIPYCHRVRDTSLVFKILAGSIFFIATLLVICNYFGALIVLKLWGISSNYDLLILFIYFVAACLNIITSLLGFPLFATLGFYTATNYSSIVNGLFSILTVYLVFNYFSLFLIYIVLICEISLFLFRISHLTFLRIKL